MRADHSLITLVARGYLSLCCNKFYSSPAFQKHYLSNPVTVLPLAHLAENLKSFNFGLHLLTSKPSFFFQWAVNQGLLYSSLLDCISGVYLSSKLTPILACLCCYNEMPQTGWLTQQK